MNPETFYATIKLITGEEVLSQVSYECENDQEFFILSDPIIIKETMHVDHNQGVAVSGLVPKKWQLYATDSMTIVYKTHVIAITELDKFGVEFYQKALIAAKLSSPIKRRVDSKENVGYVGSIDESRELLEKMYDMSPDVSS